MTLTKGLIRADIIAAKQAISYFDETGNKDIKNIAAYHLQQAAEKTIKLQIYQKSSSINDRKMYTHDLSRLVGYAESEGIPLNVPQYIYDHLNSITEWETGSRYDIGFSVRIDVLRKTLNVMTEWIGEIP